MLPPDNCAVGRRLSEEFSLAARLYAEAVARLTGDLVTASGRDYQRLCDAVEQAQARSELAGRKFKEHVASHGCGGFQLTLGVKA
jgi:hypothetical protein